MKNIGKGFTIAALSLLIAGIVLGVMPLMRPPCCGPVNVTQLQLANAGTACNAYWAEFGEPPVSLNDLTHNRKNIVLMEWGNSGTNDVWGNPLRFKPYDAALGYGSLISCGRDGLLGGTSRDADIEVRFGERKVRDSRRQYLEPRSP